MTTHTVDLRVTSAGKYQATCTCGEKFSEHPSRVKARLDAESHARKYGTRSGIAVRER